MGFCLCRPAPKCDPNADANAFKLVGNVILPLNLVDSHAEMYKAWRRGLKRLFDCADQALTFNLPKKRIIGSLQLRNIPQRKCSYQEARRCARVVREPEGATDIVAYRSIGLGESLEEVGVRTGAAKRYGRIAELVDEESQSGPTASGQRLAIPIRHMPRWTPQSAHSAREVFRMWRTTTAVSLSMV
jgi:hypothetical protein